MEVPRRFLFRGYATGVAARIRRPSDEMLCVQAACALPVIGGSCESKAGPQKLSDYLSFEAASASAVGDFVNPKKAVAITLGQVAADEVPAQTTVISRVEKAAFQGRFTVALAQAQLNGRSPKDGELPALNCNGSAIEGVELDGCSLAIKLSTAFFARNSTKAQLGIAYAAGLKPQHQALIHPTPKRSRAMKLPESNGLVFCTIVEKMYWDGKPHPDATIDGNALVVPDFGRVFFGEMFISDCSRRLTMVRLDLGSPTGGESTLAEAEANGPYWPAG